MRNRARLIREFAASDSARLAIDAQRRDLARLFASNALAPSEAAELCYENIEFAPPGADGDSLIQNAAETLLALDLLAQAAELLRHQVFYRLRGRERAIVGARLADISILRNQPQDALDVLDATYQTRLPEPVEARRQLLEARANYALGEREKALRLVAEREDRDALKLAGEIYETSGEKRYAAKSYIDWLAADKALLTREGVHIALRAASLTALESDRALQVLLVKTAADRIADEDAAALFSALTRGGLLDDSETFEERYQNYFNLDGGNAKS